MCVYIHTRTPRAGGARRPLRQEQTGEVVQQPRTCTDRRSPRERVRTPAHTDTLHPARTPAWAPAPPASHTPARLPAWHPARQHAWYPMRTRVVSRVRPLHVLPPDAPTGHPRGPPRGPPPGVLRGVLRGLTRDSDIATRASTRVCSLVQPMYKSGWVALVLPGVLVAGPLDVVVCDPPRREEVADASGGS